MTVARAAFDEVSSVAVPLAMASLTLSVRLMTESAMAISSSMLLCSLDTAEAVFSSIKAAAPVNSSTSFLNSPFTSSILAAEAEMWRCCSASELSAKRDCATTMAESSSNLELSDFTVVIRASKPSATPSIVCLSAKVLPAAVSATAEMLAQTASETSPIWPHFIFTSSTKAAVLSVTESALAATDVKVLSSAPATSSISLDAFCEAEDTRAVLVFISSATSPILEKELSARVKTSEALTVISSLKSFRRSEMREPSSLMIVPCFLNEVVRDATSALTASVRAASSVSCERKSSVSSLVLALKSSAITTEALTISSVFSFTAEIFFSKRATVLVIRLPFSSILPESSSMPLMLDLRLSPKPVTLAPASSDASFKVMTWSDKSAEASFALTDALSAEESNFSTLPVRSFMEKRISPSTFAASLCISLMRACNSLLMISEALFMVSKVWRKSLTSAFNASVKDLV